MKIAERIVMILIVLTLVGGGFWFYFSLKHKQQDVRDAVARGEYEIYKDKTALATTTQTEWRRYYPELIPMTIGSTTVMASIADSLSERIKGLSDTPYLPEGIVKLFAFGAEGEQSIWMKDMNYPIDIIWVAKDGKILYIKDSVSPDTYPESFASPKPAFYVIEANAGFASKNGIMVGDEIVIIDKP